MKTSPWMQVGPNGHPFHLVDLDITEVQAGDIIPALSKICRFGAQTRHFYSVAQHSVLVSHLVPKELAWQGLVHDFHEAYVGDIVTPIKRALKAFNPAMYDSWKIWLESIEATVARAFSVPYPMHPKVKRADLVAFATERRDLMPRASVGWDPMPRPSTKFRIEPLSPDAAETLLWERYLDLVPKPLRSRL